jgi:hypothetical protein
MSIYRYMTASKDLTRRCRRCLQSIKKGETYRISGWELVWNLRRWVHERCDDEGGIGCGSDSPSSPPSGTKSATTDSSLT